jgi:hypothetical protein
MGEPTWDPVAIEQLLNFGTPEAPTPLHVETLDSMIFFLYNDAVSPEQKKAVSTCAFSSSPSSPSSLQDCYPLPSPQRLCGPRCAAA